MLKIWRRDKLACLVVLIVSVSTNSNAVSVTYDLGFSVAKYDNINLVANPATDEWLNTLRARMILVENSTSIVANINADVSALYYKNQPQQNSVVANINAVGRWIIKPRQFEWYISDVLTQTSIDPLQSNTQLNRQDTNSILTGPNYFWRLNSLNNLNFEARAGHVSFANGIGDNNRSLGAIRWLYQANASVTTSANFETEKLNFSDAAISDYVRQNLYARVNYVRGRNTYTTELGITNINYNSQSNQGGQRYLLSIQNQRTRNSNIRIVYSRRITDTGSALSSPPVPQTNTINQTTTLTPAGDVYTDKLLLFSYTKNSTMGSFFFTVNRSIQDYRTQNIFDVESTTVSVLPTYNFSQTSSVSFEARQVNVEYKNITPKRRDTDKSLRIIYNYNSSKSIRLSLAATHLSRESTDTNRNYIDNNILFTFTYTIR